MTEASISKPESWAPPWADQVRHPDLHSTEFWYQVGSVTSIDCSETTTVAVVQNGPDAPVQILVAGVRFTLGEATELAADALVAIRIVQQVTRARPQDL